MLTRIKIHGFKSLLNCELLLGTFTCIAGENAVGKSNFFDALVFLSNLADKTIIESAKSIRSENQKHSDIRDIFFKSGEQYMDEMTFEVDMLIPKQGIDDLGQTAEATITSLRYILQLKLNSELSEKEPIEIIREELLPITQTDTKKNVFFEYKKEWLHSVLSGRRSTKIPFISTEGEKIRIHQDSHNGRVTEFIAHKMPRTLLSTVRTDSPTAFLVRQEMRSWMLLQFEPSALRQPNSIYETDLKNVIISENGYNLPATLFRLHTEKKDKDVYQQLTNKLKELVEDITEIKVDKDEKRDLLTLQVQFKSGLKLPAQSLSDGTLRFLGLAILEEDSSGSKLICLEEPENGINPKKIAEMVSLLSDMATDTDYAVDEDNPLRQVIINTHSPIVVSSVEDASLYLAKSKEYYEDKLFKKKITFTSFSALKGTWKTEKAGIETTTLGEISAYLDKIQLGKAINMVNDELALYTNASNDIKPKRTVSENVSNQLKFDFNEKH